MGIQELSPKHCHDLREADPGVILLDVRSAEEYAEGHPRGSLNVPVFFFEPEGKRENPAFVEEARLHATDPSRRVILSCRSGVRSLKACALLEAAGYEHLVNLRGGFLGSRDASGALLEAGWQAAGLPTGP